jgi:hypothetical protein
MIQTGILTISLVVAFVATAHAQANCIPIQLSAGASSVTVKGTAKSDEPFACFTLATGRGQTATLKLIHGPKDDVAFSIPGVVDDHDSHSFKTDAKTYTINVFRTMGREPDEPFTMQVSVK